MKYLVHFAICLFAVIVSETSVAQSKERTLDPASYSPVAELNALYTFQQRAGYENYSDGFGLNQFDDKSGLMSGWTKNKTALGALVPFARATGGGSFYALWNDEKSKNMSDWPVVLFGDEGGEFVVAGNVIDFLRLLTIDVEPSIYKDEVSYYKDKSHRASDEARAYRQWLQATLKTTIPKDPETIAKSALAKHQKAFRTWAEKFLK
jgi:hypothetical protein